MSMLSDWLKKRPHSPENLIPPLHAAEPNNFTSTSSQQSGQVDIDDLPACWTLVQCETFKTNNNWLIVKNKALGCSVCSKVHSLCTERGKHLRISSPWQQCLVRENGKNKESQQASLRKKIFEHKKSDAHIKAVEVVEKSKKARIESSLEEVNRVHFTTTERVFRTVYKIAKMQRPLVDLPVDIDLQILNGLPMGKILHSDKTCHDIVIHIAQEMKKIICVNIVDAKQKISVLIDESTTLSRKTTLVVVIRTYFEDYPGDAYVFNLDLIELTDTTAESITNQLLSCLYKHRFDQTFLEECLIAFACDGASVMLGKKKGVAKRLQTIFPKLVVWHCSNHRLELAVNDCVKEVCGINHFKIFVDKLYSLYNQSPKKQVAAILETQLLKIGRIFSVRWVASSRRTVNAILQNYRALSLHFDNASTDQTRDGRERAKYDGLKKYLTSTSFVQNLTLLADALDELGDLSEQLQRQNMNLTEADRAVRVTIRVLESMATTPGSKFAAALHSIQETQSYKDVALHEGKVVPINHAQFFTSLANNLRNRMISVSASNTSTTGDDHDLNVMTYMNLLESLKVLEPRNWPKSNDRTVIDIQHGDNEVRNMCQLFHLKDYEHQIIRGFRTFKMCEQKGEIPDDLKPLLKVVATIPISTSECERNFSSMNEIVTPLRSSLNVETIAALLFINCVGPPLTKFNPEKYVRSWLAKGRHSAEDTASRKRIHKEEKRYDCLWKLL